MSACRFMSLPSPQSGTSELVKHFTLTDQYERQAKSASGCVLFRALAPHNICEGSEFGVSLALQARVQTSHCLSLECSQSCIYCVG